MGLKSREVTKLYNENGLGDILFNQYLEIPSLSFLQN